MLTEHCLQICLINYSVLTGSRTTNEKGQGIIKKNYLSSLSTFTNAFRRSNNLCKKYHFLSFDTTQYN